jgi:zinc protease
MNYILGGGGFASRLMKVVRDDMGLAYSIYSTFSPNKEPGYFQVEVQTKNESASTVIVEILGQLKKMTTEHVSDRELQDAKSFLKGSFPRRLETTRKIGDFLSAVRFFNLGDDYIEKYPGYVDAVTKEDVLRVARKYLDDTSYVLVVVGKKAEMNLAELQRPEQPH